MKKLSLEIATENSAFEDNPAEVGRILQELARRFYDLGWPETHRIKLWDSNGNKVGEARFIT